MSDPFFSIVIPCYNSQDYILETLVSIHTQTFRSFEVILIDDHSSDESLELATQFYSKYQLPGLVLKRDEKAYPKGVSGCRNQGISLAKGEWICFLDSDDLFYPEKLKRVYELIQQNPSIGSFHHAMREFNDVTGETIKDLVVNQLQGTHAKLPQLLDGNNICTSTVTIRKTLLLDIKKFNVTLFGIEDYYAWLNISKLTSWYYDTEILTSYRVRAESLMGFKPLCHYITQNTNMLKAVASNKQFTKQEWKRLENHLIYEVMGYYCNNSVNRFGLWSTCIGLLDLVPHGYLDVALRYIFRSCKRYLLQKLLK